jgi:phage portal protein BeeE
MQLSITKNRLPVVICRRANIDIAKYRFPLTKKRQQPRIKTQSSSTQARFFSPNSLMTTFIFQTMAISLLLRGNALARIVYDASGNPIETIFINWDKVTDTH